MQTILPGSTITAASTGRLDHVEVEGKDGLAVAGWWVAVARIAMLEVWVSSDGAGLERAKEVEIDGRITALGAIPRGLFRVHPDLPLSPHSVVYPTV